MYQKDVRRRTKMFLLFQMTKTEAAQAASVNFVVSDC
jgi:hypothetical protein